MADKRKLQGEIDRCLKKVAEGVEQFDDIWQKVHNAANANQKEKYEADLKKEIKKLQRLRDQIKTWMASNDIKDKRPLVENRKLIETQMERFKVVERETKTKAYSKEGLGLAAKVDPAQREREEARAWLTDSIDSLNRQVDQFESEIESLIVGTKKKKLDRDRQERSEELQNWVERHRYHVSKLETVMRMLDNCSLETDQVKELQDGVAYYIEENQEPEFMENEFLYDDLDLDDTIMGQPMLASPAHINNAEDDWEASLGAGSSPVNSFPLSPTTKVPGKAEEERKKSLKLDGVLNDIHTSPRKKVSSTSSMPPTPPPTTQPPRVVNKQTMNNQTAKAPTIITASKQSAVTSTVLSNSNNRQTFSGVMSQSATSPPPVDVKSVSVSQSVASYSAAASSSQATMAAQQRVREKPNASAVPATPVDYERSTSPVLNSVGSESLMSRLSPEIAPTVSTDSSVSSASLSQDSATVDLTGQSSFPPVAITASILSTISSHPVATVASHFDVSTTLESLMRTSAQTSLSGSPPLLPSYATVSSSVLGPVTSADEQQLNEVLDERAVQAAEQPAAGQPSDFVSRPLTTLKSMAAEVVAAAGLEERETTHSLLPTPAERGLLSSTSSSAITASVPSLQATLVQPLEPILGVAPLGRVHLTKDRKHQQTMLDAAYMHLPLPADSEKVRTYLSRNAYPTPPYHHQHPPSHFNSFEMFQRLPPETLFFVFYYQEGTRAQYLAAKALKKQSWRFHTKYMMWFQRYEDPKTITDEYEQGTYIYFDYEKWQQRRKEGFTFEYRYLEDKDLP